jgi:hypothetical protein
MGVYTTFTEELISETNIFGNLEDDNGQSRQVRGDEVAGSMFNSRKYQEY